MRTRTSPSSPIYLVSLFHEGRDESSNMHPSISIMYHLFDPKTATFCRPFSFSHSLSKGLQKLFLLTFFKLVFKEEEEDELMMPFVRIGICMYRYRSTFVEMPMGSGVPTGPRGGNHRDRGSNIPTPRYHRYHVTHADTY